ncbi:hypothetical protein TNCV_1695441 [Trichonephila clavipes]|nr:hypothetical protein TNCV_1695441 [Trichonephila clavipes]
MEALIRNAQCHLEFIPFTVGVSCRSFLTKPGRWAYGSRNDLPSLVRIRFWMPDKVESPEWERKLPDWLMETCLNGACR